MMKEIIKNIWIKSIDFVYHSYIYNSGWLGIIGSFSTVLLFVKFGINVLPYNVIGFIVAFVISFVLYFYYDDGFKLSNIGYIKGFQIMSLSIISVILLFCISGELGLI